jgi:hypothetical protein
MQCEQDLADLVIADGRRDAHASGLRGAEIPPHRFRVEPQLRGNPFLCNALAS